MQVDAWRSGRPLPDDERSPARRAAWEQVRRGPLPPPRSEHWSYTSTRALSSLGLTTGSDPAGLAGAVDAAGPATAVFVGDLLSIRSEAPGAVVARGTSPSMSEAFASIARFDGHEAFVALNTAFHDDVLRIEVPPGVHLTDPIRVVAVSGGQAAPRIVFPRVFVRLGVGASARVVERVGTSPGAPSVSAPVVEVLLEEGASLSWVSVVETGDGMYHLGTLAVSVGAGASFEGTSIAVGGGLTRRDLVATLAGPGARVRIDGVAAAGGNGHVDHHTLVDHAVPDGRSRESFRNVAADRATVVFNGKVVVREGAQRSDSDQQNRSLLLSDDATIDSKPELEIYADDVKCAHGSAIGSLDPAQIAYLRMRGIPLELAHQMLVRAFCTEVSAAISDPVGREEAAEALDQALDRLIGGDP